MAPHRPQAPWHRLPHDGGGPAATSPPGVTAGWWSASSTTRRSCAGRSACRSWPACGSPPSATTPHWSWPASWLTWSLRMSATAVWTWSRKAAAGLAGATEISSSPSTQHTPPTGRAAHQNRGSLAAAACQPAVSPGSSPGNAASGRILLPRRSTSTRQPCSNPLPGPQARRETRPRRGSRWAQAVAIVSLLCVFDRARSIALGLRPTEVGFACFLPLTTKGIEHTILILIS
jgi:hypothetical protein